MVEVDKKSFGAFLMLFSNLVKKITFKSQFTAWWKIKKRFCKKLKYLICNSKNRFALDLTRFKDKITIVFVPGRSLLVPQRKLTMVLHMILPLIYTVRCLFKYQPDVFYDTTG